MNKLKDISNTFKKKKKKTLFHLSSVMKTSTDNVESIKLVSFFDLSPPHWEKWTVRVMWLINFMLFKPFYLLRDE